MSLERRNKSLPNLMSPPETPEAYCDLLLGLSSNERHQLLKELEQSDLFLAVMRLLPERLRDEFWWLEKRDFAEEHLKRPASADELQKLVQRQTGGWPAGVKSLVDQQTSDDEIWLFEAFPGDKGYALVRRGHVVDFSVIQVDSI